MNDNAFSSSDSIWQQYQFIFDNNSSVDTLPFDSIHEKITSLSLQDDGAEIKYEKVDEQPLTIDVYIEKQVDDGQAPSLIKPVEQVVYTMNNVNSIRGGTHGNNLQVKVITNKGAVKDPPPTSRPLL